MGYIVSSVYAVSPNDTHAFFIYFLPSSKFEPGWVNDWMDKHFKEIAEAVGPHKGVIIAPSPKHDGDYLASLLNLTKQMSFDEVTREYDDENIKHAFFGRVYSRVTKKKEAYEFWDEDERLFYYRPCIIFSRTPIHENMDKNEAVLIELGSCKDEKELGKVIDILFSVIKSNDMSKLENLHQIIGTEKRSSKSTEVINALNNSFELKPNFFGLGINFNYLLQKIAETVLTRKKSD